MLASTALSTVTSFARVVGSASPDGDGDSQRLLDHEEYDDADGYTKGANGLANVFSGSLFQGRMGSESRRSQLIRAQRRSLNGGRMPAADAPGAENDADARPDEDSSLITTALRTLERDMAFLDNEASLRPQLSGTEVGLLLGAVLASGAGPIAFPGTSVTELLAPAAAACE